MLVMRTIEDPTYSCSEFVSSEQSVGFDDLALAVNPLGLDGVQPRTLLGQKAADDPHSTSALFDPTVVFAEPSPDLFGDLPARALSQMSSRTSLPRAWSFSAHHERNRVVMELTGLPSTKRSHVSPSSSGR
jgi:hypothetical protein